MPRHVMLAMMLLLAASSIGAKSSQPEEMEPISLMIWVHVMSSDDSVSMTCTYTDEEIKTLVAEANKYWEQAGVTWEIGEIHHRETRDAKGLDDHINKEFESDEARGKFRMKVVECIDKSMPRDGWLKGGLDLVLVEDLGLNGGGFTRPGGRIYLPRFGRLKAGVHQQMPPVVLAHEFGHALGLQHAACELEDNFMLGRCESRDGSEDELTAGQIKSARGNAMRVMKRQQDSKR